jgi:hypothetical protein
MRTVETGEVGACAGAKEQRRNEDVERRPGEDARRVAATERPLRATAQPIATTAKIANSLTKTSADMGSQYRRHFSLPPTHGRARSESDFEAKHI